MSEWKWLRNGWINISVSVCDVCTFKRISQMKCTANDFFELAGQMRNEIFQAPNTQIQVMKILKNIYDFVPIYFALFSLHFKCDFNGINYDSIRSKKKKKAKKLFSWKQVFNVCFNLYSNRLTEVRCYSYTKHLEYFQSVLTPRLRNKHDIRVWFTSTHNADT